MTKTCRAAQAGMTLIEVLISVLILAIGLLGAAAIQLNALKYTDSAAMTSQASFIAYDMMDRIRANVIGNATSNGSANVLASYGLSSLSAAPAPGNDVRSVDLADFKNNITDFAGTDGAQSKIVINGQEVTITIYWNDRRAQQPEDLASGATPAAAAARSFVLTSRIGVGVTP